MCFLSARTCVNAFLCIVCVVCVCVCLCVCVVCVGMCFVLSQIGWKSVVRSVRLVRCVLVCVLQQRANAEIGVVSTMTQFFVFVQKIESSSLLPFSCVERNKLHDIQSSGMSPPVLHLLRHFPESDECQAQDTFHFPLIFPSSFPRLISVWTGYGLWMDISSPEYRQLPKSSVMFVAISI